MTKEAKKAAEDGRGGISGRRKRKREDEEEERRGGMMCSGRGKRKRKRGKGRGREKRWNDVHCATPFDRFTEGGSAEQGGLSPSF
jgi:hypothetical protein